MNDNEATLEDSEPPPPSRGELTERAAQALEEAVASAGRPTSELDAERLRLAAVYLDELDDPVSAAVHVESLLERVHAASDPAVDLARRLTTQESVAARVAEKLANTFQRLGDVRLEADILERELEVATVPRLDVAKRRLAHLKHAAFGDTQGALTLLEELLLDAPDDAARIEYLQMAVSSGLADRAARTLTQVLDGERDPAARAAALHDLGVVRTAQKDTAGALASFVEAIETGARTNAVVAAAEHILGSGTDSAGILGPALAALALWSSNADQRAVAAERLALHHQDIVSTLEQQQRWKALCCVLEASSHAMPDARAAHLARLGQVRLRLRDAAGAFAAFEQSLEADPDSELARQELEALMGRGEHRGTAAAILEPIYRADGNDAGVLRALGARAEVTAAAPERLALLESACDLALASGDGKPFAMGFVGRGLREAVQYAPETLARWIDLARAASGHLPDRRAEARVLSAALGDRPLATPDLVQLAHATFEALSETDDIERALAIGLSLFEVEPKTLDAVERLVTLGGKHLAPDQRIGLYESVAAQGPGPDRLQAKKTLAALYREETGDPTRALMVLQQVLSEVPDDADAIEGLIATYARLDDPEAMLAEIDDALEVVEGPARARITLHKAEALSRIGQQDDAAELLGALLDVASADESTLEGIAARAHDDDEQDIYRRALERLAESPNAITRTRALERLGDYHFELRGDRQAAIDSWKPAAQLRSDLPEDDTHAQNLYERILDASPNDTEAAQHLVGIYSSGGHWDRVPEVYSILLRGADRPDEPIELLIELEQSAVEAGAIDELVSMLDETIPRVSPDAHATLGHLLRIKARTLEKAESRQEEAARAYRDLLEISDDEEDLVAYEALTERLSDASARHEHARRQWSWHARNTVDPTPVLAEWARAEEDSGDLVAAIDVYERALLVSPDDIGTLENLVRLKSSLGDADGVVAALRRLRALSSEDDAADIDLKIANLLVGPLGRPGDAVEIVGGLLAGFPPRAEAEQIVTRALSSGVEFGRVADQVEQASRNAPDNASAARILELLVDSDRATELRPDRRAAAYVRLAELADGPAERSRVLTAAVGAMPESERLWECLEQVAKDAGSPRILFDAFRTACDITPPPSPEVVERMGHRVVERLDDWSATAPELAPTLSLVLAYCPGARWALDRVKLALSAQGRWDELFALYDAAIAAAPEDLRAELLDEAALCARDLAGSAKHAATYLEALRALRPDDAGLRATLERMYERLGRVRPLLDLLTERLPEASRQERITLRKRIAILLARAGELPEAERTVELALGDGAKVTDLLEPLEGILAAEHSKDGEAVQTRTAERLREHFDRTGDVVASIRVLRRALGLSSDVDRRAQCMRQLVSRHLATEPASNQRFARVSSRLTEDAGGDPRLLAAGLEVFLDEAIARWKAEGAAADGDEAQATWWAAHALVEHLTATGRATEAATILERAAELPFDRTRRRQLARDLAWLRWDRLGQKQAALDSLRALFAEDPVDAVASGSLARFAQALVDDGLDEEHATLWEAIARAHGHSGRKTEAIDAFQRAATAWKSQGEAGRAIAAHGAAADLGAVDSLEAMARLHVEQQDFGGAADAFERLFHLAAPDLRAGHAMALADACERLGKLARARAPLEAALGAAPGSLAIRQRLAGLYRSEGDFGSLATLLEEGHKLATQDSERLAMVKELAGVYLNHLDDPAAAIEPLRQARELDPNDVELARTLGDALFATGDAEDAAALFRSLIYGFGDRRPKARASIHQRLAKALVLGGQEEAAVRELETAMGIDPTSPNVLGDLARLHLARGNHERAESTYRALLLALHHPSDGEAVPTRAEVYVALSDLARRRGDTERADDLIASAFEAADSDEAEARALTALLQDRGDPELHGRALRKELELSSDPETKAAALAKLAEAPMDAATRSLLETELAQLQQQAVDADETSASLWEAAISASRALGGDETADTARQAYLATLDRVADRSRGDEQLALWRQMAHSAGQSPRHLETAATALERIVQRMPDDSEAALALADAFARSDRTDDAIDLLTAQLGRAEQAADTPRATRLSLVLADTLSGAGKSAEALAATEHILDRVPRDPGLLDVLVGRLESQGSQRLGEALERLMAIQPSERVPALARRLYAFAKASGDEATMLRALERGRAAAPDELFFVTALARAHLDGDRAREALQTVVPVLAEREDNSELLRIRGQALQALGEHEQAVLDLEMAHALDEGGKQELLGALRDAAAAPGGAAHATHLFDLLDAEGRGAEARQVLERHQSDRAVLERTARLATKEKRFDDAEAAHRALLSFASGNPETEHQLALAIADDCRRQGRLAAALDVLEAAHAREPGSKTRALLQTIFEREKNHERLAELLAEEASEAPEHERGALWCRAAELLLEEHPGRALGLAEQVETQNPDDATALRVAAQAALALGDRAAARTRLLKLSGDVKQKDAALVGKLQLELARAHLEADELFEALDALKEAFRLDRKSTEAALLLGLVAVDLDDDETAGKALRTIAAMSTAATSEAKATAYRELARMALRAGDRTRARLMARNALGEAPNDPVIKRLVESV